MGGVPPFGAQPNVAPPPFGQPEEEEEEEEEIIREERVVKIEADPSLDESEAGKKNYAPIVAVGITVVLAGLFGFLAGAQIDRAVLANRAITAARTISNALIEDLEQTKNLKSRISGASHKGIDSDDPSADFELLAHLSKIRDERPFGAEVWADEFYQAFKTRQLLFEYYRSVHQLWDDIDEVSNHWEQPANKAALKAWPEFREQLLKINDTKGASGYGVAFRKEGGKVVAVLGTFKNSHRDQVRRKVYYKSDFSPMGSDEERSLKEYQPGFPEISEDPGEWFIRVNPDFIVGKKRQVISPGGPLIQEKQGPYRRYLTDLNQLSKQIQMVKTNQENLIQSLAEIRQARRPFTFGF